MNRNYVIVLSTHYSSAVILERYDLYSEELERNEMEQIMEEATQNSHELRNKGIHSDFSHYLEPNDSGVDLVQLIDSSGDNYTPVYFHIGEKVRKEGEIGWEEVVEKLSYDPREV